MLFPDTDPGWASRPDRLARDPPDQRHLDRVYVRIRVGVVRQHEQRIPLADPLAANAWTARTAGRSGPTGDQTCSAATVRATMIVETLGGVMGRNLVVCLDGTGNRPRDSEGTNVEILYSLLDLSNPEEQIAYYDPGVGTLANAGAWTPIGRAASRILGLLFGFGLRENLGEAYTWLMANYRDPSDRIYIFGFSRGAFTARALAGMLWKIGILQPGAQNLVPYAVSLYALPASRWRRPAPKETGPAGAKPKKPEPADDKDPKFKAMNHLRWTYARFDHIQVEYLGLWDTVRAGGILGWDLHWPETHALPNVKAGRHALSIDEKRRPYTLLRTGRSTVEQAWFAGVHSDVGGTFRRQDNQPPERLSRIPLKWMVEGATANGLKLKDDHPTELKISKANASGVLHTMPKAWALMIYKHRTIPLDPRAHVHASVIDRVNDPKTHYNPPIPKNHRVIDPDWALPYKPPEERTPKDADA